MGKAFRVDFEAEVLEKSKPDGTTGRYIGGFVSTDHLDRQGEILVQSGLDFSQFLKSGVFNHDHSRASDAVVGYPSMAELRTLPDGHRGWYVEGELIDTTDTARNLWDVARGLAKSGKRKLGFSVEGDILDRADGKVRKAIVREVAITKAPVNTQATMDLLVKSLSAGTPEDPGSGAPLQPQALEGASPKKKRKKRMSKAEGYALLLRLRPGMDPALAKRVIDYTARYHPAPTEDSHAR